MSFRIHFQDVPHSDRTRDECEALAQGLRDEFPDVEKTEVTISHARDAYSTHLHVIGKHISVNSSADSRELAETLTEAFDKAHTQLRKHQDKVVFGRRRDAQKTSPK
jgi:ribosome-associated translation inhibitor RaiA